MPIPTNLVSMGANGNNLNSVVWTVWNDCYVGTVNQTISASLTAGVTNATNIITGNTLNTGTGIMTNAIWGAWNLQYVTASNVTSGGVITTTTYTATSSTISTQVWTAWNEAIVSDLRNASPEQVRASQERQQQHQEHQARVQAERSLAEKRAEKLLQEQLTEAQRAELSSNGFFTLRTFAKSGEERIYRIRRGRSRNVEQVDASGRRVKTLCAHPAALVPDADTMLAQKLMLEGPDSQEEFLRIANHS
jgi:hypothetical protein